MSNDARTAALRLHVFGEAYRALAPTKPGEISQLDWNELAEVLDHLPSYAEVTVTFIYSGLHAPDRTFDLMARDFPGTGRRFTNLTTGTEWFNIREIIRSEEGDAEALLYVSVSRRNDNTARPIIGVRP